MVVHRAHTVGCHPNQGTNKEEGILMATNRTRTARKSTDGTPTRRRRPQPVAEVEVPKTRTAEGYTVDLTDEGKDTTRNFDKLLAKGPNGTHQEFAQWFEAQTGVELDVKTIQYTLATYAEFQRSPEHRAVVQAQREAAAVKKATREANRVERAKAAAKAAGLQLVDA
jgi:sulfur relay (sulfurtransferase) DsrC/TusE family protein